MSILLFAVSYACALWLAYSRGKQAGITKAVMYFLLREQGGAK